jgi:hypothetical protein
MTSDSIRHEIENLTSSLIRQGITIDTTPAIVQKSKNLSEVTWAGYKLPEVYIPFATIAEYRWLIQERQYNHLLFDGSLLQIAYTFRRNSLVKHRLCFYPCPLYFKPEELNLYQEEGYGLLDIVDDFDFETFQSRLRLQSPLRFDFDPSSISPEHPASHLHLSRDDCRIPVFAPLSVGHFIQFVLRHFYLEQWQSNELLHNWPREKLKATLTECEKKQLHLTCMK